MIKMTIFKMEQDNDTGKYRFFEPIREYLLACAERSGVAVNQPRPTEREKELYKKVGVRDVTRFKKFLPSWHNLTKAIPCIYLEEIGVEREVVIKLYEEGREVLRKALEGETRPREFSVRLMVCVYKPVEFPPELQTQKDCVEWAQRYVEAHWMQDARAVIPCGSLKHVLLARGKPPTTSIVQSQMLWTSSHLTLKHFNKHVVAGAE